MADFEWDEDKDLMNQFKHGISFKDSLPAFDDPNRVIIEDVQHSEI